MKNEFSPADIFIRSLQLWWVVVFFAIAGGGLGFYIHRLFPPIYSSRIVLTTSINFAHAGVLTDEKQDQAINAAGNVLLSSSVEEAVLKQAGENGIVMDGKTFEQERFSDRLGYELTFGVNSKDPNIAETLTNIWGENALTILNDDLLHSLKADAFSKTLNDLEECFQEVSVTAPSSATCQSLGITGIQQAINQTSTQLAQEITDSHAIIPSMSFALDNKASFPDSPTYRNRNLMVLSGLLIGFIAGILFTHIPLTNKVIRHK
jgi:hypothetical protein